MVPAASAADHVLDTLKAYSSCWITVFALAQTSCLPYYVTMTRFVLCSPSTVDVVP